MFDINKTRAVLWDLDDTLYSRVEAARKTFPGMFREHLYQNRDDAFIDEAVAYMMTQVKRNSMVHEESFAALLEKYPPDKPYVRANCLDYYYEHIVEFATPFEEQLGIVKRLRELGVKNAIVTNIPNERAKSQRRKIELLGIAHLFDAVVISAEVGFHKPDRRIFDYAAGLLGVDNGSCVFVGDDPDSDIVGVVGAGMTAVWLDNFGAFCPIADNPRVNRVSRVGEYFKF